MTFVVRGQIEVDGDRAKAEVKGFASEVKKAATGAQQFGRAGRGAANDSRALGNQSSFAAGSVGNLTAQFNDIGVMLAAGQNPLQLAIQQGTQITQVFGNQGAAQAGRMLKQALVSMINPLNLITIGAIAGGAALAQWALSASGASDEAESYAEKLEAIKAAEDQLRVDVRTARLGVSPDELALLDLIVAKKREIAQLEETVRRAPGPVGRDAQMRLAVEQETFAELVAQLDALTALRSEKEAMLSSTSELADQERLLGAQMEQTGAELAQNEGAAKLLRDGISASVVAAMQLAGIDMASPISAAALEAATLATNLGIAYGEAVKVNAARNAPYVSSGRGGDPSLFDSENRFSDRFLPSQDIQDQADKLLTPPRTRRGGGGLSAAARSAQQEQKAIDDLIASQQRQLDLLQEHDPVQKEMIQNREVLAKATEAERKTVEELIATRIAEEAAIERATDNAETFKNTAYDALEGLILRGDKASDVMANLAEAIAKAALQSAFLGTGPLAGIFGTSEGGGFLGAIAGAIFPGAKKNADGGMQYGPGGPRDDLMPALISPGEYIVNAQSTAANRGVLEYINAGGQVAGFATGGMARLAGAGAGPAGPTGPGGAQGRTLIELMPSPLFVARVREQSEEVMVAGLQEYRQNSLAGDIESYSNDPDRVG